MIDEGVKKRILLCWPTDREDMLQPFLSLSNDFDFVFLWSNYRLSTECKGISTVYYSDYKTPYEIIDSIFPERILFFNINSFPQVSLNIAARNSGIVTYTMHHGVYNSNSLELALEKEKESSSNLKINGFRSLYFYCSSFRLKNIFSLPKLIQFAYIRKKRAAMVALSECKFDLRMPNYFIQLSEHNAKITKELNGLSDNSRLLFIGHPFFDSFFEILKQKHHRKEDYYLLIDFPNVEGNLAFRRVTAERKKQFYAQLSSVAKSQGKRLKVKLHPAGYGSGFRYKDENIDWIFEADVPNLIHSASGCFSFYSTLIIPAIYFSKCYLIDFGLRMDLQEDLIKMGVCKKLDFFSFDSSEVDFDSMKIEDEVMKDFIDKYLYMADGNSTMRLKLILQRNEDN